MCGCAFTRFTRITCYAYTCYAYTCISPWSLPRDDVGPAVCAERLNLKIDTESSEHSDRLLLLRPDAAAEVRRCCPGPTLLPHLVPLATDRGVDLARASWMIVALGTGSLTAKLMFGFLIEKLPMRSVYLVMMLALLAGLDR